MKQLKNFLTPIVLLIIFSLVVYRFYLLTLPILPESLLRINMGILVLFLDLIYIPLLVFLSGFYIIRFFESPNFVISEGHTDVNATRGWKFVHIKVVNLDWPEYFPIKRRSLSDVKAKLIFKKVNDNREEKNISGRWATKEEPSILTILNGDVKSIPDFNKIYSYQTSFTSLSPQSTTDGYNEGYLDVVVIVKENDSENHHCGITKAYAFNGHNYLSSSFPKLDEHELTQNEYDLDVVLTGGGRTKTEKFRLTNVLNWNHVSIKRIS